MFCYKLHKVKAEDYESVLGICDKELSGKELRKDPSFKVEKKFYGEDECDEEEAVSLLRQCTIANLVGREIIKLAIERNFIIRENIIFIGDVPHAQIIK